MAVIGVNIKNYSSSRTGLITGVLLLFYGLSGAIVAQIYFHGFSSNAQGAGTFLLFITIAVLLVNLLGGIFVHDEP